MVSEACNIKWVGFASQGLDKDLHASVPVQRAPLVSHTARRNIPCFPWQTKLLLCLLREYTTVASENKRIEHVKNKSDWPNINTEETLV